MNWGQVFTWIDFCKFFNINYYIIFQLLYRSELSKRSAPMTSWMFKRSSRCFPSRYFTRFYFLRDDKKNAELHFQRANFNADDAVERMSSYLMAQSWPMEYSWWHWFLNYHKDHVSHIKTLLLFFETGFSAHEDEAFNTQNGETAGWR